MNSGVKLHFLKNQPHWTVTEARWQHWNTRRWSEFIHRPRPRFGMILLLEGQIDYFWEGERLTLREGDLGFLPKGCCYDVHFRTDLGKVESITVNFQAEISAPKAPFCVSNQCLSLRPFFENLVVAFEQQEPLALKGHFYLLLHHLLQEQKSKTDRLFEQACSLLEKDCPMEQIAKHCNISTSSLRRLFQKHTHRSPIQYRTDLKLQKACRLLTSTDQTIAEIADQLNFYDEAYFCKVFYKKMNASPALYRKEHQIIL